MARHRRSVLPLPLCPTSKCLGRRVGMCRSPSPLRASLPARSCCRSDILTALFFCAASLRPDLVLGGAVLAERPRDMDLHERIGRVSEEGEG